MLILSFIYQVCYCNFRVYIMGFFEKDITKQNKKKFVEENKQFVTKLLEDLFSRTVLEKSKTKIANQLLNAYLLNKKGKQFIEVLFSPRAVTKKFISTIPIQLRGDYKISSNNSGSKTKSNISELITIETIKHKLKLKYNNFVKSQKVVNKVKSPRKKIGMRVK